MQFCGHAESVGEFGGEAVELGTGERGLIQAGSGSRSPSASVFVCSSLFVPTADFVRLPARPYFCTRMSRILLRSWTPPNTS